MEPIKSQLLMSEVRENTARKFGSAQHYYPQWVEAIDGWFPVMFTRDQIEEAAKRAKDNPEDMPPRYVRGLANPPPPPPPPAPRLIVENPPAHTHVAVGVLAMLGVMLVAAALLTWFAP